LRLLLPRAVVVTGCRDSLGGAAAAPLVTSLLLTAEPEAAAEAAAEAEASTVSQPRTPSPSLALQSRALELCVADDSEMRSSENGTTEADLMVAVSTVPLPSPRGMPRPQHSADRTIISSSDAHTDSTVVRKKWLGDVRNVGFDATSSGTRLRTGGSTTVATDEHRRRKPIPCEPCPGLRAI
jgi:hypothetical protein